LSIIITYIGELNTQKDCARSQSKQGRKWYSARWRRGYCHNFVYF